LILPYTARAAVHVDALVAHYLADENPEAAINLRRQLVAASAAIANGTARTFPHPRPYPQLQEMGAYWVYFPPYWIAFRRPSDPVISAVWYDQANMPERA